MTGAIERSVHAPRLGSRFTKIARLSASAGKVPANGGRSAGLRLGPWGSLQYLDDSSCCERPRVSSLNVNPSESPTMRPETPDTVVSLACGPGGRHKMAARPPGGRPQDNTAACPNFGSPLKRE